MSPQDELIEELSTHFALEPVTSGQTAGPSRNFLIPGTPTQVGFYLAAQQQLLRVLQSTENQC
jgi:hypothetical protein